MSAKPTFDEALKAFNKRKLDLSDRIRRDKALSASAKAVGAELCSLTNHQTGYAWATETHLAQQLGLGHRTVKLAIAQLKAAGFIEIVKTGRNNRYVPVYEARGSIAQPCEKGQTLPLLEVEGGKERPEQGQETTENRGKKVPPISLGTSLRPRSPNTGAAAGETGGAPDGAAGSPRGEEPKRPGDRLGGFAEPLAARIGAGQFKSWFGNAVLIGEQGDTITIAAGSKFIANHIKNFFGGDVVEVWQRERPHVQRIETVVDPGLVQQAATAAPAIGARSIDQVDDRHWLDTTGVGIVFNRLGIDAKQAAKVIWELKRDAHHDLAGLRRILTGADAQQLWGPQFSTIVRGAIRVLRNAEAPQLFLPEVKRSAS